MGPPKCVVKVCLTNLNYNLSFTKHVLNVTNKTHLFVQQLQMRKKKKNENRDITYIFNQHKVNSMPVVSVHYLWIIKLAPHIRGYTNKAIIVSRSRCESNMHHNSIKFILEFCLQNKEGENSQNLFFSQYSKVECWIS